jgi:ATP-binding cassette subfamily G (WHITE) protein 2
VEIEHGTKPDRKIFSGISGQVLPGQVMGIVGPSGAGKTCLLNCLAKRTLRGDLRGSIYVSGCANYSISGYVPADEDTLFGSLTVRECLTFSANLRLAGTEEERSQIVEETIRDLELAKVADSFVGGHSLGGGGLSTGERRRASIGTEMVAQKTLLFLDEPTSGLDASTAENFMKLVKKFAVKKNHTILCVIHQPRNSIYRMLDRVLVLTGHGRPLYTGAPANSELFVTDAVKVQRPLNDSVSDWLLDLTHQLEKDVLVECAQLDAAKNIALLGETFVEEASGDDELEYTFENAYHSKEEAQLVSDIVIGIPKKWFRGFWYCFRRSLTHRLRNPFVILLNYGLSTGICAIIGAIFTDVGNTYFSFLTTYLVCCLIPFIMSLFCLTDFEMQKMERVAFQLERATGYYIPSSFCFGTLVAELLTMRILPPVFGGMLIYAMSGLSTTFSKSTYDAEATEEDPLFAIGPSLGKGSYGLFIMALIIMNVIAAIQSRTIGALTKNTGTATVAACSLTFFQFLLVVLNLIQPGGVEDDFFFWVNYGSYYYYGANMLFEQVICYEYYIFYGDFISPIFGSLSPPLAAIIDTLEAEAYGCDYLELYDVQVQYLYIYIYIYYILYMLYIYYIYIYIYIYPCWHPPR